MLHNTLVYYGTYEPGTGGYLPTNLVVRAGSNANATMLLAAPTVIDTTVEPLQQRLLLPFVGR